MSILLPNHSATLWNSARIFAAAKAIWHTSATSQHRSPFAAAKRIAKCNINFAAAKRIAKWLRNGILLRNWRFSAILAAVSLLPEPHRASLRSSSPISSRPNFGNPKWRETEGLSLPLLQAARELRKEPVPDPALSLRSKSNSSSGEAAPPKPPADVTLPEPSPFNSSSSPFPPIPASRCHLRRRKKTQEPQAPLPEPQIPSEIALEEMRPELAQSFNLLRDTTWSTSDSERLFLPRPSLFRREGTQKKLQRADCIPLLFPRLLCQILEHLGYPSEPQLERKRICREPFTLDKWNNMTLTKLISLSAHSQLQGEHPHDIPEGITVAAPAIPRAPPAAPASSQPSTSAEPRMAIPISEYRELCRALETLTASQSSLAQEMAAIRACQEQMLATQAQHCHLKAAPASFRLPPAVEPSTSTPAEPHSHPQSLKPQLKHH
ncbi:hypothetical protein CK203_087917 [Vitis vinifera]|uniref:Uncharacterized protein n=1 Tax=Vitis vinifera TaxID=29760 RepID=A0A438D7U2_VITVI|nr:hypothetical protein CK203_087917 [Vitis vinifera]